MTEQRIEITRRNEASYRVDRKFDVKDPDSTCGYNIRNMANRWFIVDYEDLGVGYILRLTSNMHDPVRPWENFDIAQGLEEANKKNYEKAKQLAEETRRIFPEGKVVDLTSQWS